MSDTPMHPSLRRALTVLAWAAALSLLLPILFGILVFVGIFFAAPELMQ